MSAIFVSTPTPQPTNKKCSLELALVWVLYATNSLYIVAAFSPLQPVFGYNSNLSKTMSGNFPVSIMKTPS